MATNRSSSRAENRLRRNLRMRRVEALATLAIIPLVLWWWHRESVAGSYRTGWADAIAMANQEVESQNEHVVAVIRHIRFGMERRGIQLTDEETQLMNFAGAIFRTGTLSPTPRRRATETSRWGGMR